MTVTEFSVERQLLECHSQDVFEATGPNRMLLNSARWHILCSVLVDVKSEMRALDKGI